MYLFLLTILLSKKGTYELLFCQFLFYETFNYFFSNAEWQGLTIVTLRGKDHL